MIWDMFSLEKLFDPKKFKLTGIVSPSVGSVVGVDIGSSFIKVVQLRKKGGKAALDTYGEIALGPLAGLEVGQATNLAAEKVAGALNDLFKEASVTSRDLVFSLPLTSTLLTVIELPDIGEDKIKEMIPIEARKYIPTAVTEVTLSHWVIPRAIRSYIDPDEAEKNKNAPKKVDVLLAAVHNDVLARYTEIAKRVGAESPSFEIEVFSGIRAVMPHEPRATMILDIGAANTRAVVVEEGVVRSSHLISVGSQDVTLALARGKNIPIVDAEGIKREFGLMGKPDDPVIAEIIRLAIERVYAEANRIIAKYQAEKRISIEHVILCGGGSLMKGALELAQKSFGAAVVHGAAFERVETPPVLTPLLKDAGPEFAIAVGLALRKIA